MALPGKLGPMDIQQNQVKRALSNPESVAFVRQILDTQTFSRREDLAREVCQRFGFHDFRGEPQLAGCQKALRELEARGHFVLPKVPRASGRPPRRPRSPRRSGTPVPYPQDLPSEVGEVQGLKLVLVTSKEHLLLWNEMMVTEHPQGTNVMVGRQLRYLIGSDHGWLGGIGVAAAARHLADRDAWIGWDQELLKAYRQYLVGMNRFLLRPGMNCKNLASKVLGMFAAALPGDFNRVYNYSPWLVETFVDTEHFSGTSYKAANWIQVGTTCGRGRQDRFMEAALSTKAIFVYPLVDDFRVKMDMAPNAGKGPLKVMTGLDGKEWAEHEFGGANLGDSRLSRRLVEVAKAKGEDPGGSFNKVVGGNPAEMKAYYRFIDQPDNSEVTLRNILAPHRKRTIRRMMDQKVVLCVQDGTDLNFNNLEECEGLGVIGTNQTNSKSRGLHLHTTLAVATNGVPLGILRADCDAPPEIPEDDKRPSYAVPLEEKKLIAWVDHLNDVEEASGQMPNTRLVSVCDREADFFEFFDEQRKKGRVELLVRAKHDRNIDVGPVKMFSFVREAPILSRILLHIPRQSARPKKIKQAERPKRPGRMAEMEVRAVPIKICPPSTYRERRLVDLWVVNAREESPPAGAKAVEWFLLTTIPITSAEEAEMCLRWYCLRWRIEDWHRVLKTGCRVEQLQNQSAERLTRAVGINLVIAWHVMLMTLMGREAPELPAEVLFSNIELRTLRAYAKKKQVKLPITLNEAVKLVGRLGGHLGRKNDPPPGHQVLWQGYTKLQAMALGFALYEDVGEPEDGPEVNCG